MAPQKRSAEEANDLLDGIQAVLLDIEGTTTPLSFIQDKLFPYVRDNLETYVTNHYDEEECQKDVTALRDLAGKDKEAEVEGVVEIPSEGEKDVIIKAIVNNVSWQMDKDRKSTALKQLQGHICREAYKQGKVKAELYDDVIPTIEQLTEEGKKVYIFSSGSVEAQKLFFAHTEEGDIQECISGFYDTEIGDKKETESYKKIVEKMGLKAEAILFLTDAPQEATAANKAGMKTQLVVRPGNVPLSEDDKKDFSYIESFAELYGDEDEGIKKPATGGDAVADDANGDGDGDVEDDDGIDEEDVADEEEDEEEPEAEGEADGAKKD